MIKFGAACIDTCCSRCPNDFDIKLDAVGGDNLNLSLEVTKPGGTLISILGFNEALKEKAKSKGVNGYLILVSSNGDDMKMIAEYLGKGFIKSHVSATFPFENIGAAHRQVESGHTIGKVVVTVPL